MFTHGFRKLDLRTRLISSQRLGKRYKRDFWYRRERASFVPATVDDDAHDPYMLF